MLMEKDWMGDRWFLYHSALEHWFALSVITGRSFLKDHLSACRENIAIKSVFTTVKTKL